MKTSRQLHTAILSAIILDSDLVDQVSDHVNTLRLEMTGAVNKHDPKAFKHYKAKLATLERLLANHVAAQDAITEALQAK